MELVFELAVQQRMKLQEEEDMAPIPCLQIVINQLLEALTQVILRGQYLMGAAVAAETHQFYLVLTRVLVRLGDLHMALTHCLHLVRHTLAQDMEVELMDKHMEAPISEIPLIPAVLLMTIQLDITLGLDTLIHWVLG